MMRDAIKRKNRNAGTYITLCVLSVFVLIPIIYMVSTSFKTIDEILTAPKATLFPVSPSAEGYVNMWSKYPLYNTSKTAVLWCSSPRWLPSCFPPSPVMASPASTSAVAERF